ncbi:hypothetical protein BJF92_11280 [Rhizobium rhizosphaerae]|uniref:Prohead serine protease domain-containing protein n=1 Tax=Xaviernesmea rhizosphaerae TaxID=1672749 RepID=A0A1Q9AMS1_9HYPH|nr:HK97 family phage prohead protease [Xaviernesmea rhizosphaerae]OLP56663.1 hypothetical protein BJF92_11280 [Xaviernesmea rhizosphaerae]
MERKFTPLDEVDISSDDRTVRGYASVFGGIDSYRDTIVKGAYASTIKAIGARGLPMLSQHDPSRVIGRWTGLAEDDRGLIVEGVLTPGHSIANDVYASLKAGHVDGLSIGFRIPPGGASERADGVRVLKKLDLQEISIVTFPADAAARTTAVKADFRKMTIRELEAWLVSRDEDRPPMPASVAKALLAGGFKTMSAERDAGGDQSGDFKQSLLHAIRTAKE